MEVKKSLSKWLIEEWDGYQKMSLQSGPGDASLHPQLLRRPRQEDHSWKISVGHRMSSTPAMKFDNTILKIS